MKKIIYFLTAIILMSCGNSNIPDDVKWEIVKEEPNQNLSKNNIDIELNKKVDEKILKEIALEVRKDREDFNNLWVFYKVKGMNEGMAWATTHFTPELEVKIIGSNTSQDAQTAKTDNIDGDILGKWRSEKSLMGGTLILFKKMDSKLNMKITFKDGSGMNDEIIEKKKNGKTFLYESDGNEEYYAIESNGNLGMYGKDGKFDEAVKIN